MKSNNSYFWGPPDSTVDWCEANYVYAECLAETFNAISSLPIVAFGVIGIFAYIKNCHYDLRFLVAFIAYTIVGIGSALFHGTLRRSAQMLDEIPMVIVNSACIYMLIEWRSKRHYPYLPHVITALTSLVLLMYMFCDQYGFFITTFVLQSAFITISSFKVANQLRKGDQSKRLCSALFTASYLMYFSGIILWLMDIILCPYVQSFHLHSFWHLLSGAATFIWLQFQIGVRGVNTGHRIAISHLILPIVAYQDNIKGK